MADMTIAKLARESGVGNETIRYYQRRRLLRQPARPPSAGLGGGVRHYDSNDVRRVRFIKSAQAAGFTLEEIAELVRLDATDDRARAREMASIRIAALDRKIAELVQARDALSALARKCAGDRGGPCPILTAFEPLGATPE